MPEEMSNAEKARAGKVTAAQRRIRALELRASGKTYSQIADEIGTGKTAAYNHVQRGLGELAKESQEKAELLRALSLRQFDDVIAACYGDLHEVETRTVEGQEVIVQTHIVKPRVAAVLLRAIMEKAKILDLYPKEDEGEDRRRVTIEMLLRQIDEGIPGGEPPAIAVEVVADKGDRNGGQSP
jgi:hypothetical protein